MGEDRGLLELWALALVPRRKRSEKRGGVGGRGPVEDREAADRVHVRHSGGLEQNAVHLLHNRGGAGQRGRIGKLNPGDEISLVFGGEKARREREEPPQGCTD